MFKIHSARLRACKWKLTLPLQEARRNEEIISLASSQVLRWIDEINGVEDAEAGVAQIRREIKRIRSEPQSPANARAIRKLYSDLDGVQFKPDYMCLVIDRNSDYIRACKGFSINGVRYVRLLGTPGGIKMSTIVFVSDTVADEIRRRIDNDRNPTMPFVPAKLEAYRALTCSASTPVSMPRGVLVVRDAETTFKDTVINLVSRPDGEPEMSEPHEEQITIVASDGCGMMLPSLAERWSEDMQMQHIMSGCCIRFAWTKGMVYSFPFDEFAETVAGKYIVKDAWGDEVDIRDVDLVLPVSMVKLWDSYGSCSEWLSASERNGYSFAATKVCAEKLESERTLNYQFIQPIEFNETDIDELIEPTVSDIKGALCGDWAKTVLYLKGVGMNERNVLRLDDDWQKALMIEPALMNDPFVQSNIHNLIKKRIDEAKVGVLKVHGNYSTACGDLYALCQSVFEMPVTGLMQAGEIYNRFWVDSDAEELLAFRAPMSCAENVRRVKISRREDVLRWFRHMTACTVQNCHDNMMGALNGEDFDGDLVMLTDNEVMLRRQRPLPTLMCAQKKGTKIVPTEDDFVKSNIASFGNEVGQITNKGTSMYEVRSHFDKSTEEYKLLEYRIRSTQAFQQESIDKAKGIVSVPMPRSWYDRHAFSDDMTDEQRRLYRAVIADRKPYFMKYIYPTLAKQYNNYIKAANKNAMREFGLTIDEMIALPVSELTDRQLDFIQKFKHYMPVGTGDCVMNRICRKIESIFSDYLPQRRQDAIFDYTILKSGSDYSASHFAAVRTLMIEYDRKLREHSAAANCERISDDERRASLMALDEYFRNECAKVCPGEEELCDIVLDLCYTKEKTKQFAWKMCGEQIIKNLIKKNGTIMFPTKREEGEIIWKAEHYAIASVELGVVE